MMAYLRVDTTLAFFLMGDLLEWPFDLCNCSEADQRSVFVLQICPAPLTH
jgi:hypothetical protein